MRYLYFRIIYGLKRLDIFQGNLGIGIMIGSHGQLDDNIGSVTFPVEPAFEPSQWTAHHLYLLADLQFVCRNKDWIVGTAKHVLQVLHVVIRDNGIFPFLCCPVKHKTPNGRERKHDFHQFRLFRVNKHLSRDKDGFLDTTIPALIDNQLAVACHINLVTGILEQRANRLFFGGLTFSDIPLHSASDMAKPQSVCKTSGLIQAVPIVFPSLFAINAS